MKQQRGFGVIAAIVVLVLLATLSAAIVNLNAGQHTSSAQDALAVRAWHAARAGGEWGLFQALNPAGAWNNCAAGTTQTLDFNNALNGISVTVSCNFLSYNEGETAPGTPRVVEIYQIIAVACNSTVCPDNARATSPFYVERTRSLLATP